MSDFQTRALTDLAAHPHSSAREIGRRTGIDDRIVFRALNNAAYDGKCQCSREGNQPWRWEIVEQRS
jgi:hypothetical protein